MTTYVGNDGIVEIGANGFGEMKAWTLNEEAGTVEDSAMGDADRTYKPLKNSWSGDLSAHFDEADVGQAAITIGASVTLTFQPRGATTGFPQRVGTALITAVNENADHDGMLEVAFSFQGSGALTRDTVP